MERIDIHSIIIIILLLNLAALLFVIYQNYKKHEVVSEAFSSDEAIANIAKIYNDQQMTLTNLNITGTATVNKLDILPKGVIVAWTGTIAPTGWALCDGTQGTPDLRGRFVLGAGQGTGLKSGPLGVETTGPLTNRIVGATGGTEAHTLTVAQIPSHSHVAARNSGICSGGDTSCGGYQGVTPLAISGDGATSSTGGGSDHNNMPPFYVLSYIMKL